jgi:hypothetical protein
MNHTDATCPQRQLPPPGPSSVTAPKSYNTLRSHIGTFRHPQGTRLISRQVSREIGSRGTARLAALFSCNSNCRTPNTDGQRSTARDITPRDVNSPVFKTPSTEVRCHVLALHAVPWDLSQFGTSLFLHVPFDFENAKVPSPELLWDLVPPIPPMIDGPDKFGKSQLAISTGKLLPCQSPSADM